MSAPVASGGPSRLRVAGLALLGAGAVAGVIGLLSLTGGDDDGTPTAAATSAAAAPGEVPTTAPAATSAPAGAVPLPSFGPTNGIGAEPTASAPAPTPAPQAPAEPVPAPPVAREPLRVYNNSTIEGLAAQAAADFRAAGWTVTDTTGYPYGVIPTSTVYFRPGTAEEAAAAGLAGQFGLRSEPRFDGIQDASPGLIVIVTKDYQHR